MAEDTNSRAVRIGEDHLTIQPFRGYKAVKAGTIIAEAMGSYQTITDSMEDFRKAYAERHKTVVTRELNRAREYGWPDKAFDADGKLELPGEPDTQTMIGVAFPQIMKVADEQLFSLLALALTPNSDLSRAYDDGEDLADSIKPMRRRLLFEAELPQLIDMTGKVVDLLRDELTGLGDQVKKMQELVMGTEQTTTESESSESTSPTSTSPEEEALPSQSETPPTTEDSSTSSTDSPEATDGSHESPSLASSGAPSSPSRSD